MGLLPQRRGMCFTSLPTEIRYMIYRAALPDPIRDVHVCKEILDIEPSIHATASALPSRSDPNYLVALSKFATSYPPSWKACKSLPGHDYVKAFAAYNVVKVISHEQRTAATKLLQTCRQVHHEFAPLLGSRMQFRVNSLPLAGWVSTRLSLSYSPWIKYIDIVRGPQRHDMSDAVRLRWVRTVLERLPRLEVLRLDMDANANAAVLGSRWREGELKIMRMVQGKGVLSLVGVYHFPCACGRCFAMVAFVKDGAEPEFEYGGSWEEMIEIDVEEEWRKYKGRRKGGVGDLEWKMLK